MKTLEQVRREMNVKLFLRESDKWFPVDKHHRFEKGDIVRTPDGEVKVISVHSDHTMFYGEILTAIHDDVKKGESYEYRNWETTVLAKVKDKRRLRKTNAKTIKKKEKQDDKDDDLLMIDDSTSRHVSNEIIINPVLEMFGGVLSKQEIKDLTNDNGNHITEGLTDMMARGLALAVKRKAIVFGKNALAEKDLEKKLDFISRQVSATAALCLLAVSVSGEGILSKAGVVSGLFSG